MLKSRLILSLVCSFAAARLASAGIVFNQQGTIDPVSYALEAFTWTAASVDARLGPTFPALNPGATENRPTLFKPTSKAYPRGYARISPWELGKAPAKDGDYWSDSGQVGYVPDNPLTDPGLDRIAVFAYYSKVFAISPRLDWASGRPHPEPQTRDASYIRLNGEPPMQPVAMARGAGLTQNEALVVYRDGLLAVAGTQTSRKPTDPLPGLVFPAHKVPTGIAITTQNEFALVTIWDTEAMKGQLAVVALEGKYIPFHTLPHMGLPNQGSWSDFKLLGYVDLPMAAPSSVAAASNGYWNGPSTTNGKTLGQLNLSVSSVRASLYKSSTIALSGYAIVASKQENKVAIVDLAPLFAYMRHSYLSSDAAFKATIAQRGPAPAQFPQTFAVKSDHQPKVIWQGTYATPTAVLAGHRIDRWSADRFKAYVATEAGMIHIIDASSLMARSSWHARGPLREIGKFYVGRNPVGMTFARRADKNLPLIPARSNSGFADPTNNVFWVACRGERAVMACHTSTARARST